MNDPNQFKKGNKKGNRFKSGSSATDAQRKATVSLIKGIKRKKDLKEIVQFFLLDAPLSEKQEMVISELYPSIDPKDLNQLGAMLYSLVHKITVKPLLNVSDVQALKLLLEYGFGTPQPSNPDDGEKKHTITIRKDGVQEVEYDFIESGK